MAYLLRYNAQSRHWGKLPNRKVRGNPIHPIRLSKSLWRTRPLSKKEFGCIGPYGSFLGREADVAPHLTGSGWMGGGAQAQKGNPIAYMRFNRLGLNSYDIAEFRETPNGFNA